MIYLDYASHTPACPAALEAFCHSSGAFIANPMASHREGRRGREELERITGEMAQLIGIAQGEIILTSGASEANNLAIKGIARAYRHVGRRILSTCLEHPSVSGTLAALQNEGYEIELLKMLPDGTIDLVHLEKALSPDTVLLCISAVDSELGAIQPVNEITRILSGFPNCHLHVDAAQAMGKNPLHTEGLSTMSFSAHKFHGICGSGGLVKRENVVLEPLIHGGASTTLYRSGTPALALAAACLKALEAAVYEQDERLAKVRRLREFLQNSLVKYPGVKINSPFSGSPYILNLSVREVKGSLFQAELDKQGVCISVKSACSTDSAPSRPVMAISSRKNAMASWRISISHLTEMRELEAFMDIFQTCYKELTNR